jgi:uncharacterized protein
LALILDSGPVVAYFNADEPQHEACGDLIDRSTEPRVVPVCVLVEVEYLLRRLPGAFDRVLANFNTGAFELLELSEPWLVRAGELLGRYRDLSLGLVDATVVAATEMLGETKLATLDHRHFAVVRPAHAESLTLLP